MRYPILPLLGITLSLIAIAGSVMTIPNFLPVPEAKTLNNKDISSLWPSHPVSVDRGKQRFERLPALAVGQQQASKPIPGLDIIATNAILPTTLADQPEGVNDNGLDASGVSQASAAWCGARYRSYRASENTYQPYSGARRQCEPPFATSLHTAVELPQHASNEAGNAYGGDDHVQWCFARYRSYNHDENTYRAFSGGIRSCDSPYI